MHSFTDIGTSKASERLPSPATRIESSSSLFFGRRAARFSSRSPAFLTASRSASFASGTPVKSSMVRPENFAKSMIFGAGTAVNAGSSVSLTVSNSSSVTGTKTAPLGTSSFTAPLNLKP